MPTAAFPVDLHQPAPAFGVPNPSPFCIKVETWLRMTEIPYRVVPCFNPGKGPKGKIPYAVIDGETIGDSDLIIRHLADKHGIDLRGGLSARDWATATAVTRMLEERTYWTAVYSRWIDDRFWPILRGMFAGVLPPVIRNFAPEIARKQVRKALHAQGTGRHSPDEIYAMAAEDLAVVAEILGDRPYLLSEAPTVFDAALYAFLASLIHATFDTPQKEAAGKHRNLVDYADRMRDRFFPEFSPA